MKREFHMFISLQKEHDTEDRKTERSVALQWLGSLLGRIIVRTGKWTAKGILSIGRRIRAIFGFIISFAFLNGVVSGIPIAVPWTCKLDSGIQDAVSIAIVFTVLFIVGILSWFDSSSLTS